MNLKTQNSGKIFSLGFLLIAALILLIFPTASSANFDAKESSGNIYLPQEMIYNDLFYVAGQSITLNATMKDDVYLAGANVIVTGPIEGDLLVAGSNVVINSEIKGDLRVLAGTVTVNGKVSGNATILAGMVTLGKNSEFGKSLIVLGGNVDVNAKINKNLYGAAGNMMLNNEIMGSAYLAIDTDGSLILQPETNIHGNLEYTAKRTATIIPGAKIQNQEKFTEWQPLSKEQPRKSKGFILAFWLAGLLGAIIVGLLIVYVFKNQTVKILKQLEVKAPLTMLAGLVYLIVTPVALLLLAITIIGLPLAFILGALFAVALYISRIFVAIYLGKLILTKLFKQKEATAVWSMILGLGVIYLLCWLPFFGWLIKLVVLLWGLGALMAVVKKDLNLVNN